MSTENQATYFLENLEWWEGDVDTYHLTFGSVTVAKVRYADVGEAEGGLMTLMRHMAASRGLSQPEPSLAGWYVEGTWDERGVWRKAGPFSTPDEARNAVQELFLNGKYLPTEYFWV